MKVQMNSNWRPLSNNLISKLDCFFHQKNSKINRIQGLLVIIDGLRNTSINIMISDQDASK